MSPQTRAVEARRPSVAFWVAAGLVLLIVLLHGAANQSLLPALRAPEQKLVDLDYRLHHALFPPAPTHEAIALVGFDNATRDAMRSYPSQKHFIAAVVEGLATAGARTVVIDALLSVPAQEKQQLDWLAALALEVDTPSAAATLKSLNTSIDGSRRLASAIERVPVMLPYSCEARAFCRSPVVVVPEESDKVFRAKAHSVKADGVERARRVCKFYASAPEFIERAASLAHSCEYPDGDGVLRNDRLLVVEGPSRRELLPSISMAAAAHALGVSPDDIQVKGNRIVIGERWLPVNSRGETMIGYRGVRGSVAQISATEVVSTEFDADRVRGKVVFVGYTWDGHPDRKVTPFGYRTRGHVPGIEKAVAHTDAILQSERLFWRPGWVDQWGHFLLTALIGLLAAALGGWASMRLSAIALPVGTIMVLALGSTVFVLSGVWIDTVFPAVAWLVGLSAAMLFRYAASDRERRFLERAVGRYVSPQVFEQLRQNPEGLRLAGEEREVTVLFADIRDFTTWSESERATRVVDTLNEHMTAMVDVILAHGGTLDKFVGDCIVAFWNAPTADDNHAVNACRCAMAMLDVLDDQNAERETPLDMGIGINTGKVVAGNMGSARLFSYTVIGDAVNVASRLEGMTKDAPYRALVGQRTRELVGGQMEFVDLGPVHVRGKAAPVGSYGLKDTQRD